MRIFIEELNRSGCERAEKLITTPTLVLMIISTIYGFGNVSIAYDQMAYAGMFWYILAGVCFFFPCCLMMAEYGSAFKDAKGESIPG